MNTQGDTSDAAFRKLMERLFLRPRHGPDPFLFVAELPPEWDIPLPKEAVIIGSHLPMDYHAQVVLDVPGDPEQAVAAVAQALTARGWRSSRGMPGIRAGGFVPAVMAGPSAGILLCDEQRRRHLRVGASPGEADFADVRLNLNSDPDSFGVCEGVGRMFRDTTAIFPALGPPLGMSLGGGGSSGGSGSSHCHTTLRGTLPVENIENHYREQLAVAGWILSEHAATGRWAWSAWDFVDERGDAWTGLLTVVEPQEQPNVRHASLVAIAARGGAGPSASARLL